MDSHNYENTDYFSLNNQNFLARLVHVHDGDTITAIIEYPINTFAKYNIRLDGIDTAELTSQDAKQKEHAIIARNLVIKLATQIELDTKRKYTRNDIIALLNQTVYFVYIKCKTMDKYGRVLAELYSTDDLETSINQKILNLDMAYNYHGGTKKLIN
jgi:endonuclease YncB( thermonuclease family)